MHSLILGMTESGKTSLAKQIIKEMRARGVACICLDPIGDPNWCADIVTSDPVEFQRIWKQSKNCLVVIDESGSVGKYSETISEAATKGRHWGHSFIFISQRATQIAPIVRDQCGQLFLFRSGLMTRRDLAEEFDCPKLLEQIEMLEFHHVTRSGYVGKKKVVFD